MKPTVTIIEEFHLQIKEETICLYQSLEYDKEETELQYTHATSISTLTQLNYIYIKMRRQAYSTTLKFFTLTLEEIFEKVN